jgi:hypothetical protein
MIPVSKPWLPEFEDFNKKLIGPWGTGILTHNGPLVQEFEKRLCEIWGVRNVIAVSNGTMAIQLALRALRVEGTVITTPFTWHATATAIKWEGCEVKFADISSDNLCLDPLKVESQIDEKTGAIMPVNVYGNPPDFDSFDEISARSGIPIIYDAAHACSTSFDGESTLRNGAISVTSFHATKLIHTAEGGACITDDDEIAERLRELRFFGFTRDGAVSEFGTNAKMTEVNAALGLCCLDNLDWILEHRKNLAWSYSKILRNCEGVRILNSDNPRFQANNLYYPILLENEHVLEEVSESLISKEIIPRRYFYPSLNTIESFDLSPCPTSEDIAGRVLCLPIHTHLDEVSVKIIAEDIINSIENM